VTDDLAAGRSQPDAPGGDAPGAFSTGGPPSGYPEQWEADVVLADGATMHVRPIRPSDAEGIQALHGRLSAETIYFRFFTPLTRLSPRLLERFVNIDYVDRMALVGVLGDDIIAVARSERIPGSNEAEVAFLVDDPHQGRGITSILLEHLAIIAATHGITRFVADTLPDNQRMLRVFHDAGFGDERTFADGVVRVAFPIEPTPESVAVAHDRERRAAARSVTRLLAPRTVAVVGASNRETLGRVVLRSILAGDPQVTVYPVNGHAHSVCGVRAYPTVLDVPDAIDLAVIVVPAAEVPHVVEQCARKHVGGLAVISAGFAERDEDGAKAERAIVTDARRNGMRVIGPASMGIINTDPSVSLNASFSAAPPRGRCGFVAQSGALGMVLLDEMARRGIGVSTFVSVGNKADISTNDLLQYWDEDPSTDMVLMYIESFGNPRTFGRVARRVGRRKPVVAVKSARSAVGLRAAGANRPAQGDEAVDALFRQSGVIRTETLEEMFDVAQLLASQPLPKGRRVAIVTNAGGPGALAADACEAAGLEVATLSTSTLQRLQALGGPDGSGVAVVGADPVGLAPDASPQAFRHALSALLADQGVDAALALYTSPMAAPADAVTTALSEVGLTTKPLLVCAFGNRKLLDTGAGHPRVPAYAFPEAAARALGLVADYADWRSRPESGPLDLGGVDDERAGELLAHWVEGTAADGPGRSLDDAQVAELLACYGVPVSAGAPLPSDDDEVRAHAVAVTVTLDPLFGSLVSVGTSRHVRRTPQPSTSRAVPLSADDVAELVDEAVAAGSESPWHPEECQAACDVVARVGRLAEDHPEVLELALHPLLVIGGKATAVAPEITVRTWEARPELALRRLR
jgi:acyl-CoA synthetase (NDP forming)/GNAT superfamily N-acetyltransferase